MPMPSMDEAHACGGDVPDKTDCFLQVAHTARPVISAETSRPLSCEERLRSRAHAKPRHRKVPGLLFYLPPCGCRMEEEAGWRQRTLNELTLTNSLDCFRSAGV